MSFENYEVSGFPQQHVLPKHSMLACHSKFNHTKWEHSVQLSSLPLLLSGFVSTVVRIEADRGEAQQRLKKKNITAILMKIIS